MGLLSLFVIRIELGSPTDVVVLTLYGTGAGKDSPTKVSIGSLLLTPDYSGPHGEYPGLDQVNVRLAIALEGSGKQMVSVAIGRSASDVVQLEFK